MENVRMRRVDQYQKKRQKRNQWRKLISCLTAIVVFSATYVMVSPAATMESVCQIPEHTHSEACYTQVEAEPRRVPICTEASLNIHHHTSACKNSDGARVCGYADFVVHQHDESCYDGDNNRWCALPVIRPHTHGDSCYTQPDASAVHQHTDACYAWGRGALICGEEEREGHTHSETECYTMSSSLVCQIPQSIEHQHEPSCYNEAEHVICGMEQSTQAHMHGGECYEETRTLTCAIPEGAGHHHSDACYEKARGELICTESTEPAAPTLICTKEEIILHTHRSSCFDANGALTCTKTQVLEHKHSDACFQIVNETVKTLTCGMDEHVHTAECRAPETDAEPTAEATEEPTAIPSEEPTEEPSAEPTMEPTAIPTEEPTAEPTEKPTEEPSAEPTMEPTMEPTAIPTEEPMAEPTVEPMPTPAEEPMAEPTVEPMLTPTEEPIMPPDETLIATSTELGQEDPVFPTLTIPVDWPVLGNVYASAPPMRRAAARANMLSAANEFATRIVPLDMEGYIETAKLSYRTSPTAEWQPVTESTILPGTADFRLEIGYNNVNIDTLLAANCQITYTLPDVMRNPSVQGKITSGNTDVGTITAQGKTVTLTFDPTWLSGQKTQTNSIIHGDFCVDSKIDLSMVPGEGHTSLTIGSVDINVNFEEDVVATSAQIDTTKSNPTFSSDKSGDYLTYTLTVTAGADGAPDVKVTDAFTEHGDWIDSYVGVTATGGSTSANTSADVGPVETLPNGNNAGTVKLDSGSMVWAIGKMNPNETRTLTYKVKLEDGYTRSGSTDTITNEATTYSKQYPRTPVASHFTPSLETHMTKQSASFTPNANGDGGGTITYTVWINADENNTYTLSDVKIEDALDGSIQGHNATDTKYLPYLSYDETSFHLYKGGSENQNGHAELTEELDGRTPSVSNTKHSFSRVIGTLQPGESKTLTYTVKVDPGVFPTAGNADIPINNHAVLCADHPSKILNSSDNTRTISKKVWSRKLAGERQDTEQSIQTPGDAYDATGSTISPMTNPGSFTVPAGSYQYQVVANEAGDWDLSSASMTDRLSGGHMEFVGYVRVDAYTIDGNAPTSDLTDQQAIDNLEARTPVTTVWVHAHSGTHFAFKPQDIGLGSGKYAYLLTYYAQPVSLDGVTQVLVQNTFTLEGTLGKYLLTGVEVNASVTVEGSNSFGAEKMSWYYEKPQENPGEYTNGSLYWIIKVNGNVIPKDTILQDKTVVADGTPHYLYNDSIVGVYTGNLSDRQATDYDDLEDLLNSGRLTRVDSYSIDRADDATIAIKLLDNVSLESGESLYVIVKTHPSDVPVGIRDTMTYTNTLQSSYDGENWVTHPEATKVLCGSSGVFKEPNRVITWDGTNWEALYQNWGHTHEDLLYDLMEPGTYIIWHVQANYLGDLSGRYRFEETIPEGMELAYVCHFWYGPNYQSKPHSVDANPGEGWERHETTKSGEPCIYYTKGRQAIWDVDGLVAGGVLDGYGAEYQIACRVTDPDVLFGSETKDFTNQIKLYKASGKEAGTSTNTMSVGKTTLTKSGNYNAATNGGRYPFIITVNPLGEDLASASDTITLVDELSNTLMLDATSIHVTNTSTGAAVNNWTVAVEGQTFRLTLPDGLPLTISYETVVNAPPDQPITIVNRAHWEGHSYTNGTTVEKTDFVYQVGGTVGSSTSPSLKILKSDQNNTSLPLAGAEFTLQKGSYANGVFTPDGPLWTGVTDADGDLIFGHAIDQVMEYNTVYCVTETKAPTGYLMDDAPHYFIVAQKVKAPGSEVEAYPPFPAGVQIWYQSAQLTYQVYNHKGEITVAKEFKSPSGHPSDPVNGTYTFGLYETSTPSGAPLKTASITFGQSDSESGTAVFKDLELDKTYYVFELDDKGVPVEQKGIGIMAGKQYSVTYASPNQTSANGATNGQTVTVTNQSFAVELPKTGGNGIAMYTFGGLLLMACASVLLIARQRKCSKKKLPSD